DLSASGVNLALDFQPNSANHSVGGLALHFDGGAHATVLAPGAATLPAYFSTPSMSPSFNGLVPSSMAPYRLALAVSDDALNQLLAASLEAGVLDQRLVGGLTVAGMPFAADAGSLALAAPGLGFEKFDPAAPIIIQLHAGVAPVARVATSGNDLLQLAVSGLEVDFRVEVVPGYEISALRVAISGDLGANVTFNAMAGTLDITAGSIMTQVDGLDSLPGVDPAASLVALNGLVSALVPSLLTGLQGIPVSGLLPTAVPLALAGIEAAGPSGDFVAIYLD
ncbi:MAG: hypothetical protein KDB53_08340, partial [Planctomycetes bacterium]|nr:hypothetical protein [Planctomycetota bacterium]